MNIIIFITWIAVIVMVKTTLAAPALNDHQELQQEKSRFVRQVYYDDYFNELGGYYGIDRADDGLFIVPPSPPPKFQYQPIYRYKHTQTKKKRKKLFVLNTWG
ncbi:hypothetical protein ACFFRR_008452 [Megaselia abdita]